MVVDPVVRVVGAVLVVLLVAACGDDGQPAASTTSVLGSLPVSVPIATDLAPSQTTAGTVVPPTLPPACDVSVLVFDPVRSGDPSSLTSIVANDGDATCEVDLSASAIADPLMEPDVWLQPGDQAELTFLPTGEGCGGAALSTVTLTVNAVDVDVAVDAAGVCGLSLIAVAALEP